MEKTRQMDMTLLAAVEHAQDAIVITTPQLDAPHPLILYVNPSFERLTGYTAKEVLGKSPRILQGPKSNKEMLAKARKALANKEVFRGEILNYKKDGTTYIIEWHIAPVFKDGELINWVSVQRDITIRKQMEEELRQAKKSVEKEVEERTKEIMHLKEKIERYATRLEQRIKKLEKNVDLSPNEKKVLLALVDKADASDEELAKMTSMKRSTVTAIKNRLRRANWFSYVHIPAFAELGAEIIAIEEGKTHEYARTHKIIDDYLETKKTICTIQDANNYLRIQIAQKISDIEEEAELYPFNSCRTFFSFSENMHVLFKEGRGVKEEKSEKIILKKNENKVLRAAIEHPHLNPNLLAQITNMSVARTTKIYKKLLETKIMRRIALPNVKKIGANINVYDKAKQEAFFTINWRDKQLSLVISFEQEEHSFIQPTMKVNFAQGL